MSETPRVWVGCLACYNAGRLIGEWFDAEDAPTDMEGEDGFNTRLKDGRMVDDPTLYPEHFAEGHEELWVFDHEGFNGLLTDECSPATARELAEQLEAVPEDQREAFGIYVGAGYDAGDFEDAYQGEWDSLADYAQELASDFDGARFLDQWPFTCIDWEHAARELEYDDVWTERSPDGGVYVFRSV